MIMLIRPNENDKKKSYRNIRFPKSRDRDILRNTAARNK